MRNARDIREALVRAARRHSRVASEAEDLAHDLVVAALGRGLQLDGEVFLRSAHGAARRHGAFLARSAARRRAREARDVSDEPAHGARDHALVAGTTGGTPLSALPVALRTTLHLLLQGLEKAELRAALGLTDAALRKRFEALRARAPLARPNVTAAPRTETEVRLRRSQVVLAKALADTRDGRPEGRVLAARDPDGHGIFFAEVLTPAPSSATFRAPDTHGRAPTKGTSC